jgi:PAS domain S-box-containing protein
MQAPGINIRFSAMYENSLDAILETIPDGRILSANPAACRLLGYTEEEICLLGRSGILDITDPRLTAALKTREEKGFFAGELIMIDSEGRKFPVHLSTSVYRTDLNEERTVIIFRDISRRKQLERNLIEREANLRSVLENSEGSIWSIDREYKLIECNTAFQERILKGIGRYVEKGEDLTIIIPEQLRKKWIGYYNKCLAGKKFTIQDHTVPPLDLEYFKYNFNPIKDSEGTVTGLTVMGSRITDLVITQKELKRKADELHRLNRHLVNERERELRQTASDLHDDLGQKLSAIKMNIGWLRSRIGVQSPAVNSKFTEINKLIDESVGSINRVVQGLRPAIIDHFGLKAAIEWLAEDFRNKSGTSVTLRFNPSDIRIDNELAITVFRIVQESLTNVIRHAEASHVSIFLSVNKLLRVEVADNGIGIRIDHKYSTGSLGIAGMYERAGSIGGRLKISARKGGGTVVTAIFRLKRNQNI